MARWDPPEPTLTRRDTAEIAGAACRPSPPKDLADHVIFALALCFSAFKQELVVRAFLIPRLEKLLGSVWASISVSSILFGAYHAYEGFDGIARTTATGLVYGAFFAITRRPWPLVVAHALHNLTVSPY